MGRGESEYREERDVALLRAWRGLMRGGMGAGEALRAVADVAAPRFFVSPENAHRRIVRVLRGVLSERCRVGMRRMLSDIMRLCGGDYSYRNVERVVYGPAPSFYLSAGSVRVLLSRYRRRERCRGRR